MTYQRHASFPDPAVAGDAFLLIGGEALPLLSAGAGDIVAAGGMPQDVALPAPVRIVLSRGPETFAFQLTATRRLEAAGPGRVALAVEPDDAALWPTVADAINASARLQIGVVVAMSATTPAQRRHPATARRVRAYGVIAAAIAVFGIIVGVELYERAFIAKAGISFVSVDLRQLRSPATGRIVFLPAKTSVAAGEPILGVTQRSGRDVSIESPCDCEIVGRPAAAGAPVQFGQPVVFLAARDARPFIVAGVDRDLLFRLVRGATVRLAYVDGLVVEQDLGPIRLMPQPQTDVTEEEEPAADEEAETDPVLAAQDDGDLVYIAIEPGRALPFAAVGGEVRVSFDLFRGSAVGRLLSGPVTPPQEVADARG
jgi:hypothetical protein